MRKGFFKSLGNSFLISLFVIGTTFVYLYLKKDIKKIRKAQRHYKRFVQRVEDQTNTSMPLLGNLTIPFKLQNIPFAEEEGVVLGVKKIDIKNVVAPYNPSIIKQNDHYLMFFRYDIIDINSPTGMKSYIGAVKLDKDFNQMEEYQVIDTKSDYSEDPRALYIGEDLYVSYNDIIPDTNFCRSIHIAKLTKDLKTEFITDLDIDFQSVEKNWVPFEHDDKGKKKMFFEYYINPHKIFHLENLKTNSILRIPIPKKISNQKLFWSEHWGIIRGGTPAKKINDNEYLSFFHSSFVCKNGFAWYVAGAYTFENTYPFKITRISNYPLLFKDIYSSPIKNTADFGKRVLFPCGFVLEKKGDKELIHVSCGENDSSIKIITIDKKKLFESFKRL